MNTMYLFSVMAFNDLGESKYLPDLQKAHTKGKFTQPPKKIKKVEKKQKKNNSQYCDKHTNQSKR